MFEHAQQVYAEMRSYKCGDLGSILAVCACAYDPIHVTAQGKSIGKNCACLLTPCTYVPFYECEGPGEQLGFAAF